MTDISLVSINIERAKHYDRIFPFLMHAKPDVICIQELYERDIPKFERELGGTMMFAAMENHPTDPPETGFAMEGVGILTTLPVRHHEARYYRGSEAEARSSVPARGVSNCVALFAEIEKDGVLFTIATTHFTWTPDGRPTDQQRSDILPLLALLESKGEFVLTGDFNAPRGTEIFTRLAEKYTDNIPPEYVWSLDTKLHRAMGGKIQADAASQGMQGYMVDGLFTTKHYEVSNVRLQDGVSDHCAVLGRIHKRD